MAAFLPDSLVQVKAMEASEDDVHMESGDTPPDRGQSMMNGEVDKESREESMDVDRAEDDRTAASGKALNCAGEPSSSPGKIGYLTLSDGRLVMKTAVSETSKENGLTNGCEVAEEEKDTGADSEVLPGDMTTTQSDMSRSEMFSDRLRDDCCNSEKTDSSTSTDSSGIKSSLCSQVDSNLKIQSSETANPSEEQTSDSLLPSEGKSSLTQETMDPSLSSVNSVDSAQQGSSVEEEKTGDACSAVSVNVSPGDAPQNDSVTSHVENGDDSSQVSVADREDVLDSEQHEPSPSGKVDTSDEIETVVKEEVAVNSEEKNADLLSMESQGTETVSNVESKEKEQAAADLQVTEESRNADEIVSKVASSACEPDKEESSPECKAEMTSMSADVASSTCLPNEEKMSECKADVEEVSAHNTTNTPKQDAQQMSTDPVKSETESQAQPNSQSLPSSASEQSHPLTETLLSKPPSFSQDVGVGTEARDKPQPCLASSPSKSTARKSVPGGTTKPKLSKVTARKTGQPQATTKVTCSSKDSKDGTIRIINLHPNSNITLKLSELEKVLKPPKGKEGSKLNICSGAESELKREHSPVGREIKVEAEGKSPSVDACYSSTPPVQNSADDLAGVHSSLKLQHRRRRKKGGTYDFPGGKKHPKKKKGSGLSSGTAELSSEDGATSGGDDVNPMRKIIKKSPHKQYTVMELFKKRSFHKQSTANHALHHRKSPDSVLSARTVSQMLHERRNSDGTVSDSGSSGGMRRSREAGHAEGGTKHMVQKLFVTKDGIVSSVTVEDASDWEKLSRENVLKRKLSGSISGPASGVDGSAPKKSRVGEGEGCHPGSPQPMVMVVAQHSQNAPGLRSILPKPHMATAVAVTASSTVPTSSTPVMASAGQKLLLAAPPLLVKPGTKVALVPVSMTGKHPFSIIPATVVPSSKGGPVSAVSSLPKLLNFQPTTASHKNHSDALRSLLTPSNGPRYKMAPMAPGSISAAQRVSVASSVVTAVSLAHSRVLTASASSSSLSSMFSSSSSLSVPSSKSGTDGKGASFLPNGLLPVTPPKTPEGEAVAEGMAAAPGPDSDIIPLCCCKIAGNFFNKLSSGATYCQALDSVDGKALGCCNKVSNLQLVRPGVKIPFMAVCEVHRKRLKMHQCCPGCGQFCTQGKFYQCRQDSSTIHNFHRQCQTERDGRLFCPHCGEESGQVEVTLMLNEPQPSQSSEQIRANLRKSMSKARMTPSSVVKKKTPEATPGVSASISDSKTISSDSLPLGPDRDNLEKLLELCVLRAERPKKYRVLPKNMYHPAAEGDMDKVFYMLMDGMDPNQTCEEEDSQTVLHAAVYSGNLALVYLLVQAGACLHTPDKSLKTPLMCAAEYGHLSIFQFLAKAGARLDDRGEDHMTCLHCASKAGHLEIIQYILDIEAIDVNATDEGGWTPLMWATESQLVNIVKYLVSRGGDPNRKDNEENNALHWAAFAGSVVITELFLDLGCELDTPNEHGDTPLHIAARQDHYEVVVILLARGANVDLKNNKDESPVSCCVSPNSQVCMALKVNKQLRSFATKLSRPEKLVHRDLSFGREKNPIACVNAADEEPCPTDYLYVNHNVETQDLHINNVITSLQSCRCKDDCSSVYCVCSRSSVKCWFDKYGRLLDDFNLLDPPLIFECNRACRCWVNCNNRVVQNGITVRLQVFRTKGRGWGVRSLMDIPKGTFICEYIGELISDQEADRREDDSYLFDLDNKDGDTYCLDARKYGNVARFINHLCEPNLVPVKVFVDHQDLRFPRICFFSSRNIKAYEELGFDYGEKFWIIKWKQFTCACGSPKCKYSTETIKRTLEEYRQRHEDEDIFQEAS